MSQNFILLLALLFFHFSAYGASPDYDLVLDYVDDRNDCIQTEPFLYICGSPEHQLRVLYWIQEIQKFSMGQETWSAIKSSGHNLMIAHQASAVSSGGKTLAALTSALSNGVGTSPVVLMNLNIPESGSHRVGGTREEWTNFTALQNFFHELSHARHKMKGTFEAHRGEAQAITDENIYRRQSEPENLNLRSLDYEKGEQIWFPPAADGLKRH